MIKVGDIFSKGNPPKKKLHSQAVIYKITNNFNEKIYIGSTKNFCRRYGGYRSVSCRNFKPSRPIDHAIKSKGLENFTFEIIEMVENLDRQFILEQKWIDALNPFGENGYNLRADADTTVAYKKAPKWSIEKFEAMREKSRQTATKYAQKTRERSSKPVYQIDKNTLSIVKEFPSALEAERTLGISTSSVNRVCRGKNRGISAGGFYWKYKADYEKNGFVLKQKFIGPRAAYHLKIKPIVQMAMDGEEIAIWDCANAINLCLGYGARCVLRVCEGERIHSYGFKWKFVEDEFIIDAIKKKRKFEYEQLKYIKS